MLHGKTGNKKPATYFATLLQNALNSNVARFITHIRPVLQQIRLLTGLNMGSTTRNIAIQLVLQHCCKTSCTFFVATAVWENSWHLATLPLVSPPNDVWETYAEIPYWWRVTTQIWVVNVISMEFLRSFLRRHLTEKLVVASPNVSCFLRLFLLPIFPYL